MEKQLFVLIICLGAVIASGGEEKYGSDSLSAKLEEINQALHGLDVTAYSISNVQKGIEGKLKHIGQEVQVIGQLEDVLSQLDAQTANNFQLIARGIGNLTASIKAGENRTEGAIRGVGYVQEQIKQVLIQVDAKQGKYEANLNEVSHAVQRNLAGLDNLLKQSVLRQLLLLEQNSKSMEQTQRRIEHKIGYLDELAALSGITANKVQLLEQGVQSLNATQQRELASIGQAVHEVGATTWQIDSKLGALLSAQKNIERALDECKKSQPQHKNAYETVQHKDNYAPPQPYSDSSYIADYE
ncbi:hypothetical protein KR222_010673 [Zaprionus bogoriensis]|nr:hypothetical protein KR222_010673 [Zaprionus bogoriensis]